MDPRRWHAYGCPWTARASRMLGEQEVKEVLGVERWGALSAGAAAAADHRHEIGGAPATASSAPASGSASERSTSSAQAQGPPTGKSPARGPAEVRSQVIAALHTLDKATSTTRQAGMGYPGLSTGAFGSRDDDEQEEGDMDAAGGSAVDGWEVYAQAVGVSVLAFPERGAAEST